MRINPKNFAKEVHIYGYHFSWKSHTFEIAGSLLGAGAIGVLFQLKPAYFMMIVLTVCVLFPIFILDMYKRMFEQKRFADAVTYAEQMLYSFQKSGKVAAALKETGEIFEGGQMRQVLDEAVLNFEQGYAKTERGLLRETLDRIEHFYGCAKIHMVHELLAGSEEYGGEVNNAILMVLNDIERWKRRGYKLFADKKVSHADNMISIIVATMLCAAALYVLDAMGSMFQGMGNTAIFEIEVIQISSFLFLLFMLYTLAKSRKLLTEDWLEEESAWTERKILSSYDAVVDYDDRKEKRASLLFSAPLFLGSAAAVYFGKTALSCACLLIGALILVQHRVGYSLAKREVRDALYAVLPQWLMGLALLLQTNNVQVAIEKSVSEAPAVLKKELTLLVERLQTEPEKLRSYTEFCKSFDVPEIQSCMKMLHAISESGTGNAGMQIRNLIQRVYEMQNIADNIRSEHRAFQVKLIFAYPVIAATVKLLVDLTLGTLYMMQMLGGMGGM